MGRSTTTGACAQRSGGEEGQVISAEVWRVISRGREGVFLRSLLSATLMGRLTKGWRQQECFQWRRKQEKRQTRVKHKGSSGVGSGAGWWWRRAGQPKEAKAKVDPVGLICDSRRQVAKDPETCI